jgi:dipeptidyl aminopeptidase/acylaminoacyl peptidase
VLQVNFRGSSGYGADFLKAAFKRRDFEMQDDLTDGVQYANRDWRRRPAPDLYRRTPEHLLLVHGAEDRVVLVEQSREMAEALEDAGFKKFRYVELPDGDHYLSREEDRIAFFRELERFLSTPLNEKDSSSSASASTH